MSFNTIPISGGFTSSVLVPIGKPVLIDSQHSFFSRASYMLDAADMGADSRPADLNGKVKKSFGWAVDTQGRVRRLPVWQRYKRLIKGGRTNNRKTNDPNIQGLRALCLFLGFMLSLREGMADAYAQDYPAVRKFYFGADLYPQPRYGSIAEQMTARCQTRVQLGYTYPGDYFLVLNEQIVWGAELPLGTNGQPRGASEFRTIMAPRRISFTARGWRIGLVPPVAH